MQITNQTCHMINSNMQQCSKIIVINKNDHSDIFLNQINPIVVKV